MMKTTIKAVLLITTIVSAKCFDLSDPSEDWFKGEENSIELTVFNFQEHKPPVTSSLLYSKNDAILFDAQFSLKEAKKIVSYMHDTNITPRLVIITSGDPDYYFGSQAIVEAFPFVEIIASPRAVKYINQTKDAKLKFWRTELADGTPDKIYMPKPIDRTTFYLDNRKEILMMEIDSYAAYVWIPEDKIILGGSAVAWGIHVWVVDSKTPESRSNWRLVLRKMLALEPKIVIPGHFDGERPMFGDDPIRFTLNYLETFEEALQRNNYRNSTAVINYMKERFGYLDSESSLELSAKVLTGEATF